MTVFIDGETLGIEGRIETKDSRPDESCRVEDDLEGCPMSQGQGNSLLH